MPKYNESDLITYKSERTLKRLGVEPGKLVVWLNDWLSQKGFARPCKDGVFLADLLARPINTSGAQCTLQICVVEDDHVKPVGSFEIITRVTRRRRIACSLTLQMPRALRDIVIGLLKEEILRAVMRAPIEAEGA